MSSYKPYQVTSTWQKMLTTTDKYSGGGYCELHMAAEGVRLPFQSVNIALVTAHVKEEEDGPTTRFVPLGLNV